MTNHKMTNQRPSANDEWISDSVPTIRHSAFGIHSTFVIL